jgi:predicted metalloprotease with PDZ domain
MANYLISCSNPEKHYIIVRIQTTINKQSSINFQLPSWRPGRYELANYAQNIKEFHAYNEKNEILPSKKITTDCWEINCADCQEVILIYSYYACQLDAGASYYDDKQLYVNPVNCLGYFEGQIEDKCQLKLSIPNNYKIASALVFDKNNEAIAQNFHQLADSPFIASDTLMHEEYKI